MSGNIFNSNGTHVAVVNGGEVFDLDGRKIYELKGINLYRLSGELVGHLNSAHGTEKRLDRFTDWVKVKNRKHPAMQRVMEAFG